MQQVTLPLPSRVFGEHYVEADGFRIRYLEAGTGPTLVHLHGASGLRLTPAHELLQQQHRLIAFEMPGFGASPENTRSESLTDMAATMLRATDALGLDRFSLWGTSFGAAVALRVALAGSERLDALVLESSAAIRPPDAEAPRVDSPEALRARLFAHPERNPEPFNVDPGVRTKQYALVRRFRAPNRDAVLEERLRDLTTPTLVLFGTLDRMISPDIGHVYLELMPNANLVFVYDAAHEIASDRPEAFAEVLSDFLERREAFVISRRATQIFP